MIIEEFIISYPIYSLAIISIGVTLISTLAQKWLTDQEHMKHLKSRQKEIQKELKNCKDDCAMKELNAELLKLTGMMMKASSKPLVTTLVPFLILFWWLRSVYVGILDHWIWYYLGFSLVSSTILRKLFKVH